MKSNFNQVKICILALSFCLLRYIVLWETAFGADNSGQDGLKDVTASIKTSLMDIWASFVAHIPYFVAGLILLIFTWVASKFASRLLSQALKRTRLKYSLRELADRFTVIAVWIVGILLAAMIVFPGLTPSKALGAMGIASIAVGFAFKDIFENFFAGVLILWRFPFENGDFIECKGITGKVEKVSVRMTEIRLPSGELVVVPNSMLFKNPVEVLTDRDKRRVTTIVGVAYGENVKEAVKVIKEAVHNCKSVAIGKDIQIFPHAFGSSSIDIEIAWWTDSTPVDMRRSRGEVIATVKGALDDAGIEIPFPYRTLTFKEALQTKVLSEKEDINEATQ